MNWLLVCLRCNVGSFLVIIFLRQNWSRNQAVLIVVSKLRCFFKIKIARKKEEGKQTRRIGPTGMPSGMGEI